MNFKFRELYRHPSTRNVLLETDLDQRGDIIAIVALDSGKAAVRIHDVRTGQIKAREEANVNACWLSADGSRCVVGGVEPFVLLRQGDRYERVPLITNLEEAAINFLQFISDDRQFVLVANDAESLDTPVLLFDCTEGVSERSRIMGPEGLVGIQVVKIDGRLTLSFWCEDYPSSHWVLLDLTDGSQRKPELKSPSEPWIFDDGERVLLDTRCCHQDARIVNLRTHETELLLVSQEDCRSHVQVSTAGNVLLQQNISCIDLWANQTLTTYTLDTYERIGEASVATHYPCLCCGGQAVATEQKVDGEWCVVIYSIDLSEVLGRFPLPNRSYRVTCPADNNTLLLVYECGRDTPASVALLDLEF